MINKFNSIPNLSSATQVIYHSHYINTNANANDNDNDNDKTNIIDYKLDNNYDNYKNDKISQQISN